MDEVCFRFRLDAVPNWFMDMVINNKIITTVDTCYIHCKDRIKVAGRGSYIFIDSNNEVQVLDNITSSDLKRGSV